ncbi:hypothetical protein O8E88_002350 [Flavobacterium psychrophilum]|uniref:hypothetical protein n=1 Tax=Flavobacterium psychrophilum TaxID=96345 RepID=UPI0004F796FD|nr:hypothetical protein [Flavobacterium psychrophilum]AIN75145.1 hypothetical protein FPG3_06770 [Flavobacterium psychrophilum FPG3]EKT2070522.1 hypothetical protein [Flavobacterium psychrophilum]EKT2072901.1 hypothetical protein [Flavobacterium psychrophilum]EKT4492306.1 hypothetical protein [Flavobacterium psychrophilum]EKT4502375.1 hypothetical protein [Flavobacterium psychrophilum]
MKNLKTIGLLILLTVVTVSCHKDDPTPTPVVSPCDCDTSTTIETKSNVTGVLKKNSGTFKIDNVTANYYIQVGTPPGITYYYLICNDSILSGITVTENVAINVTFSGSVKEFCAPTGIIFLYPTQQIKLTQIQQ